MVEQPKRDKFRFWICVLNLVIQIQNLNLYCENKAYKFRFWIWVSFCKFQIQILNLEVFSVTLSFLIFSILLPFHWSFQLEKTSQYSIVSSLPVDAIFWLCSSTIVPISLFSRNLGWLMQTCLKRKIICCAEIFSKKPFYLLWHWGTFQSAFPFRLGPIASMLQWLLHTCFSILSWPPWWKSQCCFQVWHFFLL